MNARQAYLAWLRQEAPATYAVAVQKVLRKPRTAGGLNRDLISSMYAPSTGFGFLSDVTLQPISVDNSIPDIPDTSSSDASSYPAADLSTVDTSSFSSPDLSSFDTSTPAASSSGGGSSWLNSNTFSSLINTVGNVADTIINANAQSNLVQLNTQRAAQGLWPVQANGQPVPQSQLYPSSSPSLAQFESAISTQGGISTPLIAVAGLGLLALLLLKRS
jgi:hypothetical protein